MHAHRTQVSTLRFAQKIQCVDNAPTANVREDSDVRAGPCCSLQLNSANRRWSRSTRTKSIVCRRSWLCTTCLSVARRRVAPTDDLRPIGAAFCTSPIHRRASRKWRRRSAATLMGRSTKCRCVLPHPHILRCNMHQVESLRHVLETYSVFRDLMRDAESRIANLQSLVRSLQPQKKADAEVCSTIPCNVVTMHGRASSRSRVCLTSEPRRPSQPWDRLTPTGSASALFAHCIRSESALTRALPRPRRMPSRQWSRRRRKHAWSRKCRRKCPSSRSMGAE